MGASQIVDFVAVDEVISICAKLKAGAEISDRLWSSSEKHELSAEYLQNGKGFMKMFDDLCRMKRVRTLLRTLQEVLQEDIAEVEEQILPASRQHGLASLPDDVLACVFDELIRHRVSAKDLSLVCKRFQRLVSDLPSFWQHVHDNCSLEAVKRRIKRSKALPLCVTLGDRMSQRSTVIDILHECIPRWGKLTLLNTCLDDQYTDLPAPHTTFPNVVELNIRVRGELYERWSFPSLMTLETTFLSFPLRSGLGSFSGLTRLEIRDEREAAGGYFTPKGGSAYDLLTSLGAANSLEYLSVQLDRSRFRSVNISEDFKWSNLPGPTSLSTLKVQMSASRTGIDTESLPNMAWFTRALSSPTLRSIHLKLLHTHRLSEQDTKLQPRFFTRSNRISSHRMEMDLKQLTLDFGDYVACDACSEYSYELHEDKTAIERLQIVLTSILLGLRTKTLNVYLPSYATDFDFTPMLLCQPQSLRIEGKLEKAAMTCLRARRWARRSEVRGSVMRCLEHLDIVTSQNIRLGSWKEGKRIKDVTMQDESIGGLQFSWVHREPV